MNKTLSQRGLRCGALLLLMAVPSVPALARTRHGHSEGWARDRYAAADRMREALNGRPPGERSRRDYQRVINAYRNVYYGAPTSTKADPSAVAVAETLVEIIHAAYKMLADQDRIQLGISHGHTFLRQVQIDRRKLPSAGRRQQFRARRDWVDARRRMPLDVN